MKTLGDIFEDNEKITKTFFKQADAFIAKRKEQEKEEDMNKLEEYLQGDHGNVISNY